MEKENERKYIILSQWGSVTDWTQVGGGDAGGGGGGGGSGSGGRKD